MTITAISRPASTVLAGHRICTRCGIDWEPRFANKNTQCRDCRDVDGTCRNGHPWTPENTYVLPNGNHKNCRICNRVARQRSTERNAT